MLTWNLGSSFPNPWSLHNNIREYCTHILRNQYYILIVLLRKLRLEHQVRWSTCDTHWVEFLLPYTRAPNWFQNSTWYELRNKAFLGVEEKEKGYIWARGQLKMISTAPHSPTCLGRQWKTSHRFAGKGTLFPWFFLLSGRLKYNPVNEWTVKPWRVL